MHASPQHGIGQQTGQEPEIETPCHKRPPDKSPTRPYQFHRTDNETAGIDAQPHGIVDECKETKAKSTAKPKST